MVSTSFAKVEGFYNATLIQPYTNFIEQDFNDHTAGLQTHQPLALASSNETTYNKKAPSSLQSKLNAPLTSLLQEILNLWSCITLQYTRVNQFDTMSMHPASVHSTILIAQIQSPILQQ